MRVGWRIPAVLAIVVGAVGPLMGDASHDTLAVTATVTRSCSVQTVGAATGATVAVSCTRGATPGLITGASSMPVPMTSAPQPSASTSTAARDASATTPTARPVQTTTVVTPERVVISSADGNAAAAPSHRQITINF
jgi:hypothetical protein